MLNFTTLSDRPYVFLSLTGIRIEEFERLLDTFSSFCEEDRIKRFYGKKEVIRDMGAGVAPALTDDADKLLFILVYFKCYPIQELQGFLFDMSQESANDWIHRLTPILEKTLGYKKYLPVRKIKNISEFLLLCPTLEFFIDGMERPINRPSVYATQKEYYSGKKKKHTTKHIVITNKKREVIFLSGVSPGRNHDKHLLDDEEIPYPKGATGIADLGFVGYAHPNLRLVLPNKKPIGKELDDSQKKQNTTIGSIRVSVEHSIAGIKRSRIAKDIYRNHKNGFNDQVMCIATGLHNFRVNQRYH